MVKRTSTEARREEIADAVLQVIRRDGIGAASVRTVADEAGLSTGSLRHFFGTQSELLLFAMELVTRRVHERIPAIEFTGDLRADARLLAEQFVPLDADRRGEMDVWQAFVVAARTDPALAEVRDRTDREMYEGFLRLVGALHDAGLLAPDTSVEVEAARLHALVDGLAAHGVNHPRRMDAERLRAVLDAHFAALLVDGDTV
ncbi:TetR/AcrR family transcriptional regulator [Prescottella equi]|uniref:TetR/AcrR family transcriptional regulator n=1 Tax=Rhodococcus hoagii TaxID=43767 RepID=UPI0009C00DE0|nr:TetR family transcriptional regulator C-terminal domain-containing protein [Prescottella equi]MBM4524437.1 TetR family transcriptional regulator [Prescottella equi]MBM4650242.1 TetR family transcriptional regulator [Prescottella equi]MBM4683319.1 TetR family transcriptional regulator [Prescottella equi]NKR64824.1 TetR family transcriptional regulator [Prescottella equi]OQQ31328.1 TetR family transcriptional regulator [Prescottella equi]